MANSQDLIKAVREEDFQGLQAALEAGADVNSRFPGPDCGCDAGNASKGDDEQRGSGEAGWTVLMHVLWHQVWLGVHGRDFAGKDSKEVYTLLAEHGAADLSSQEYDWVESEIERCVQRVFPLYLPKQPNSRQRGRYKGQLIDERDKISSTVASVRLLKIEPGVIESDRGQNISL